MLFIFLLYLVSLRSVIKSNNIAATVNETLLIQNDDTLEHAFGPVQFASIIFRHGARTPDSDTVTYPLDPHRNHSWTSGFGLLTDAGKRQMFQLGQWFRKRYSNLIADTYQNEEVTVYSSDRDRSIVSALCFLHGLYPATEKTRWQKGETWQPTPVHTVPVEQDIIHLASHVCPRIRELKRLAYDTPRGKKLYRRYQEIIAYVGKHAGYPFAQMKISEIFRELRRLKTTLLIQSEANLTLPAWTNTVYPEPLSSIEVESIKLEVRDPMWRRLSGGSILQQITNEMKKKASNTVYKKTLRAHSAHEKTIESVCSIFNVSAVQNGTRAEFGTTLIIELRKKNSNYTVTTALRNGRTGVMYYYDVPGCGYGCPLEKYLDILKPFIPQNWKEECGLLGASAGEVIQMNNYAIISAVIFGYLSKNNFVSNIYDG